ncbi:MAG: hypothetical protein GVY12_02545 [Bacteroidetes bacterium]|jgi:hypothetical protein|nr:hypothetical protein [Bacteroidota bacterium]
MGEASTFSWAFEPEYLFRLGNDEIRYDFDDYHLVIHDGEVEAFVSDLQAIDGWPNVHDIREVLQQGVERILDSQAIWEHEAYELSFKDYDIPESMNEGLDYNVVLRNLTLQAKAVAFFEIEARGPDGEIIYDSKKARKQRQIEFGELVHRYRSEDPWANFAISRYQRAIEDPDREFVHLFDILEALRRRFGSRDDDIKANLYVGDDIKNKLGTLGQLANDAPVRQGRHPGRKVGQLRDATKDERKVARQVARQLVFGYLLYLDKEEA